MSSISPDIFMRSNVRKIHDGQRVGSADQHVGLSPEQNAPEVVCGLIRQPGLRGIAAHIDLAVF
jgi:hypothetical protein